MATVIEQLALQENDRIRWCPNPPSEASVIGRDYGGVMVRWDSDLTTAYLEFDNDRRWAYITVEERVRVRAEEASAEVAAIGTDYGYRDTGRTRRRMASYDGNPYA